MTASRIQQREEIALQPEVADGFKCAENVRRLTAKPTGGQQLDQCLIGLSPFRKRTLLVRLFHEKKRPAATMTCFRRFTRRV